MDHQDDQGLAHDFNACFCVCIYNSMYAKSHLIVVGENEQRKEGE
jgi:hypothetical protein